MARMRWLLFLVAMGGCQALFRLDPLREPDGAVQPADLGIDMPLDAPGCSVFLPRVDYPAMSLPASLVIFDVNGDTRPDVVLGSAGSRAVQAFKNTGTSFEAQGAYSTTVAPTTIASGQFTSDINPDLVIADGTAAIQLLPAQGSFSFATGNMYAMTTPSALAVGDYNGDGHDDVVATDSSQNQVRAWSGMNDGTLASTDVAVIGSNPGRIVATSLDGDAKADFAIADTGSQQYTTVLGNQFQPTSGSLLDVPADVAAAALDTAGSVDLVFALPAAGRLETVFDGGTGGTKMSLTPGQSPELLALADFDKDGMDDVVFYDGTGPAIVEMRGNGDGTFGDGSAASERVIALPAHAVAIGAADFNNDQRPDVAVALAGTMPRLAIFSACP